MHNIIKAVLCAGLISGCTSNIISTHTTANGKDNLEGIPYFLPQTELTLEVFAGYFEGQEGAREYAALDGRFAETVNVVPDNRVPLYAAYDGSVSADDHVCIGLSPLGLLQSVQIVSAERSDDILVRLAQTASILGTGGGAPPGLLLALAADEDAKPRKLVWEKKPFIKIAILAAEPNDRFNDDIIRKSINAHLNLLRAKLGDGKIELDPAFKNLVEPSSKAHFFEFSTDADISSVPLPGLTTEVERTLEEPGVYVRSVSRQRIFVQPSEHTIGPSRFVTFVGPDPAATTFVKLSRSPFVQKEYNLALTDGTLNKFEVKKPSAALEISSIPLEVAGAIIETPARFFGAIARSARSEAGVLQAQAELLRARAEIEKVRKDPTQTITAPGNAGDEVDIAGSLPSKQGFTSNLTCFGQDES